MTQEDYNNLDAIIQGDSIELNAVESLIKILNSPIARRKGIMMTPEECAEWSNELENFFKKYVTIKELTIEQKAQRYDEAIDICKKLYNKAKADGYSSDIEDYEQIFHELKESEDEKIIKDLISHFKETIDNIRSEEITPRNAKILVGKMQKWIAWLEKQVEQKPITFNNAHLIDSALNDYCCKQYNALHKENGGVLSFARLQHLAMDIYGWCKEQGQQEPTDKVGSKFEVGDWIVNNEYGHVIKVLDINKEQYTYRLDYGDTYGTIIISLIDNDYHLWTIQDAKDGDVLFTSSTASHETFTFKSIDKNGNAECYFTYDSEDGFREGKYHFIGKATDCKPATKEQRDLLFQKMKEAGYEWDAEKKELKKIEQKSSWSEEDEKILNKLLAVVALYYGYSGNVLDKQSCTSFLKSLKNRYTWKPSDEQMKALWNVYQGGEEQAELATLYNDLKKLREE